jgi:hypothetical protein
MANPVLDEVSTEELIDELLARHDTVVLGLRKNWSKSSEGMISRYKGSFIELLGFLEAQKAKLLYCFMSAESEDDDE